MIPRDVPANVSTYGSDEQGLVCGYVFDGEGLGTAVSVEEAQALLAVGAPEQWLWLHFSLTNNAAQKWMRDTLTLPPEFHELLSDSSRSTRVELHDAEIIAVLNDVHYDFSFDASDISTLWLYANERIVVTVRLHPLRSVDRLRASVRRGQRLPSSVALVVHLLNDQCDVLAHIVRSTNERVDGIEDSLLADRIRVKRAELGSLRRLLVRLQRLLAPEPAALFRLLHRPPAWIPDNDLSDLRHSTEEFNVVLSDTTALQERIKLLQEEIAARVAESDNRSLHVLTIVTVLALPINMVAGLLGMNVGGIPYSESPEGFWRVLIFVLLVTGLAAWLAFRRRDR